MVAAIDFGTHSTGFAWTEVTEENRDPRHRRPLARFTWPGAPHGANFPKDLSALLLGANGEVVAWGHEARREWVDRVETGHHGHAYITGLKMALKADAYHGPRQPGTGAWTVDTPAAAFPLVVASLRRMFQLALDDIQKCGYREDQIRWCLTVPAIWDDAEKQLMRDAARAAGMPADQERLLFAIEPEVAALHCQIHLARVFGTPDETADVTDIGSRFLVVDCGGGTVDITSYRVDTSPDGQPQLSQLSRATGGRLGSEYIDEEFVNKVLVNRLGGLEVIDRIRARSPRALLEILQAWEGVKNSMTAHLDESSDGVVVDRDVLLPLPGEVRDLLDEVALERIAALPGGRNRIQVSAEETRTLFESVVGPIVVLVRDHLAEMVAHDGPATAPEHLLLVGGLSESHYLQARLLREFGDTVRIIVPPQPSAAVLFGAVHFGYEPEIIRMRRTRYTYGCASGQQYDPAHDPVDRWFQDDRGRDMCRGRFDIFVRNGDELAPGQEITHRFVPNYRAEKRASFGFYRTQSRTPRYVDEPGCETIGELSLEYGEEMMALPFERRGLTVRLRFGETEIRVIGATTDTGLEAIITLRLDTAY